MFIQPTHKLYTKLLDQFKNGVLWELKEKESHNRIDRIRDRTSPRKESRKKRDQTLPNKESCQRIDRIRNQTSPRKESRKKKW